MVSVRDAMGAYLNYTYLISFSEQSYTESLATYLTRVTPLYNTALATVDPSGRVK